MWGSFNLRRALWASGRLLARDGSLHEAAVLFAAVKSTDHVRPPWIDEIQEPADYRQCIDLIETGLSPDALLLAEQQGADMTLEDAVGYALRVLGPLGTG